MSTDNPTISAYHDNIIEYYHSTENAYKDAWHLDEVHAIHYGYKDEKARRFKESLIRMNEVMMEFAAIQPGEKVLDAGCGIGGSSLFLAKRLGCHCTGITITPKQVEDANNLAASQALGHLAEFRVMDYSRTAFPDNSFDIVWGCESICYAEDKGKFIAEAYRVLKPGGRLVIADGMVTRFINNQHPAIKKWLAGWQVNYLETPEHFQQFMQAAGFTNINYRDITAHTKASAVRLLWTSIAASIYSAWKTITFRNRWTPVQKGNIRGAWYQYWAMRKELWGYGLVVGQKALVV